MFGWAERKEATRRAFVFIRSAWRHIRPSQASVLPGRKDGLSRVFLEDGGSAIGDRGRPHGASRLDAGVQKYCLAEKPFLAGSAL